MFASSFRILLFLILVATACSQPREQNLNGHWVTLGYFKQGAYDVLDCEDSICLRNKDNVACWFAEMDITETQDGLIVDDGFDVVKFLAKVNGDTLTLWLQDPEATIEACPFATDTWPPRVIFVKMEKDRTAKTDLFSCLDLTINLPEYSGGPTVQCKPSFTEDINLGKQKVAVFSQEFETLEMDEKQELAWHRDSTIIQLDDVFASADDVPLFVKRIQDLLETQKDSLIIRLNVDKDSPPQLKQKVIERVKSVSDKLRIVETKYSTADKKLVFVPLN